MDISHSRKSDNKNLLLYHFVCPAKYRRSVFSRGVEQTLKETCQGIEERYEMRFIEIGTDEDHVHFMIQSVPVMRVKRIIQIIKIITAREIFIKHPEVKQKFWGGKFWTSGYYVNTVGLYANAEVIKKYVEDQGKVYQKIHSSQLNLFE